MAFKDPQTIVEEASISVFPLFSLSAVFESLLFKPYDEESIENDIESVSSWRLKKKYYSMLQYWTKNSSSHNFQSSPIESLWNAMRKIAESFHVASQASKKLLKALIFFSIEFDAEQVNKCLII